MSADSERIAALIDRLCHESHADGPLTPEEFNEFERTLQEDKSARQQYVDRMWFESALRASAQDVAAASALRELKRDGTVPVGVRAATVAKRRRGRLVSPGLRIGILASLAVAVLAYHLSWRSRTAALPDVARNTVDSQSQPTERHLATDTAGTFHVGPGGLVVGSGDDGVVLSFASGEYRNRVSSSGAANLDVLSGVVGLSLANHGPVQTVSAGPLEVASNGASFGVSHHDDRVRIAVFDGEIAVKHSDRRRALALTRGEGLELLSDGSLITAVIGGHERFADVRAALPTSRPRLGNTDFSYPSLASENSSLAPVPAGWTLVSHPIANADQMSAAGGLARERETSNQVAYCDCDVLADGRTTYTSLYQAAGRVAGGDVVSVQVDVQTPGQLSAGYRVALYSGETLEGPDTLIVEEVGVATPDTGGKPVVVRAAIAEDSEHTNRTLFLILAASPTSGPACGRVEFDHVRLTVKEANE